MYNFHRNKEPYQSSTIYRVTASVNSDFEKLTLFEKLERARVITFPYDYPTPDNISIDDFKNYFEKIFISKYWNKWFSADTFEDFEMKLYSKMLEIMPTYNQALSIVFSNNKDDFINVTETISESNTTNKNENVNKSINSKFPSSMMQAGSKIGDVRYANDGDLSNGTQNASGSSKSKTIVRSGNMLENMIKFDNEFSNIFTKMLKEFSGLFSALIF